MILYSALTQIKITDLSLKELHHLFDSLPISGNCLVHSQEIENYITVIIRNIIPKIFLGDESFYLFRLILNHIFQFPLIKFDADQFRLNLINLIAKDLKKRVRFVSLWYGNLNYYLPTGSNIKFMEKTQSEHGIDYYKIQFQDKDNYERYGYCNNRWENHFTSKLTQTDNLDYYRAAFDYIETLYHFIAIN